MVYSQTKPVMIGLPNVGVDCNSAEVEFQKTNKRFPEARTLRDFKISVANTNAAR